jgi:hypothetical protein
MLEEEQREEEVQRKIDDEMKIAEWEVQGK